MLIIHPCTDVFEQNKNNNGRIIFNDKAFKSYIIGLCNHDIASISWHHHTHPLHLGQNNKNTKTIKIHQNVTS